MCWVLSHSMNNVPELYCGVDLNRIAKPFGAKWADTHDRFSICDDHKKLVKQYGANSFTMATCFEVIEHMHVKDGRRLLCNVADLMAPGGLFFLSTPCFDGRKAAANHLHEYTIDELAKLIEKTGRWDVKERFGTFASWPQIKKVITAEERALFEELHRFYSHDVLSCFLAPKYPDHSRNNVWVLTPRKAGKK